MFFILNPKENLEPKETFGFRSTNNTPQLRELKPFKDDHFNLIYSIKYKPAHNKFQEQLKKDKLQIINNLKVIVGADKTSNLYKMEVNHYNKKESITEEYKKCNKSTVSELVKEAENIARHYNFEDQIVFIEELHSQ